LLAQGLQYVQLLVEVLGPTAHARLLDLSTPLVLTLWKDADPDIPILKQAKAEYAWLRQLT